MKHIYFLISRTTLLLTALVIASFTMFSCEGDDGPAGPVGPAGSAGTQGVKGDQGTRGEDGQSFFKTGHYEGTVTGTRQDGTAFSETFKYEYSEDPIENMDSEHSLWLGRYKEGSWEADYFYMSLSVQNQGTAEETLVANYASIFMRKELTATKLFRLNSWGYTSNEGFNIEITNYVHNSTNGALSFDFSVVAAGEYNSTQNELTITGKFSSGSGKIYKDVVSRK